MRAAVLREFGEIPAVEEVPEPSGAAVGDLLAAGMNPIDLRIASGTLGERELPYVVGSEAIVRHEGRRLYVAPGATFAERVAFDPAAAIEVPEGVDDATAVGYGIAGMAGWLALERGRLAAGEDVLVLGASGIVGLVAVQAARAMGAGRVVAAGRSVEGRERAVALGADAGVALNDLASAGPYDLVIDPLWGQPAADALVTLRPNGRLVHLGQSAGATAPLPSGPLRFNQLEVLGHTNFAHGIDSKRRAFEAMCAARIRIDSEAIALERVATAWRRQSDSPGVKLVVVP